MLTSRPIPGSDEFARALCVDHYRDRIGDADCVGDLYFGALSDTRRDDVLRHVARGVCARSVYFRGVLARKSPAAVSCAASIGVDDDLSPGESRVTDRAPDYEPPGRVYVGLHVFVEKFVRHYFPDYVTLQVLCDLFLGGVVGVLRTDDDRIDADWSMVVVVFDGHLALRVGAEVLDESLPAAFGHSPGDAVGQRDGQRHEFRCLIDRVTDHHALVAGA